MDGGIDPTILAQAKVAFASFAGASVRLFLRPVETLRRAVACTIACVACGLYGTPFLMWLWSLPDAYSGGVGAALGLLGLSLAESALKAVERFDIAGWIKRRAA